MKNIIAFIVLFGCCIVSVLAQTNGVPTLPPLPTDTGGYWKFAISGIAPIIVWVVRLLAPKIPTVLLPTMTPFIGLALGLILNKLANANLGWVDMAQAGALAVFIREVVNQTFTKQMEPKP